MAMSVKRKRVLRRELRDVVFRLSAAGGLFLGFLWALERPSPHEAASCAGDAAERIGECVGDSILSGLLPYVLGMGVGIMVGGIVGAVLARTLIPDAARTAKAPSAAPVVAQPGAGGRWLAARYAGTCGGCGTSVRPGDRIRHRPGLTLCAACGASS
jgi:hypothetical protein